MKKQSAIPLLAAAAASVLLTACSGGTGSGNVSPAGSDAGVKELKVVIAEYSKDHTKTFWDAFAKEYQTRTGIKINLQIIGWDNIDQQTSTMIQNGSPPDILNLNAYASYAKDGLLYNSDEVLPAATKADLIDAFVKSGTYNGKMYGFPDLASSRAMFYNKDLFRRAGITAPPTTWTEFVSAAEKITAIGDGTVGYALPLGPEEAQAEFSIWAFNNGGAWKTDGNWTINSARNVETLQFLKDLSTKNRVTQNNPGKTNRTDGAFSLFSSGKAGMVVGLSQFATSLDQDKKINYGVAAMPTKDGGPPQTYGVTDYLMAFKKAGNQDAVKKFYELYYQPDQVNTWIKAEGFLPVTKSGLKAFASDAGLKVYLDTLPNIHLTPTDDPTWDKIKIAVQQNIGTAVAPSGNPAAVLGDLQKLAKSGG
ncbi:extracellular solute-binding protein [Nonomuraea sp. NPDC048901]|uniref:extracellular solute-binding protein n=1 Tax=Nonomuraea sp. NPDC048901 TaxID=3155627 RepID=UPI0033D72751